MIPSPEDLDLVDGNLLVDAIARRYECYAFVAARDKALTKTEDGSDCQIVSVRVSSGGDRLRVAGLCAFLSAKVMREIHEDMAPPTTDD